MSTVHLHDKIKKNENFIQFFTYMQGLRIKDDVADRTIDLVATEFQSDFCTKKESSVLNKEAVPFLKAVWADRI